MRIELPIKRKPISVWQANEKQWMENRPLGSAKPYTDDNERRKALAEWGTPPTGVDYILRSAREAPTRKLPGTGGNVISRYTSKKMGKRLATESRRVEFPAVIKADFDGFTREFYCQPVQVAIPRTIRSTGRNGKVTEYRHDVPYTPDILRLTNYGPFVEEWKTEHELIRLAKKQPDRFFKRDGTWYCPERETYFKSLGITFCLRSSAEHDDLFAANLEHLSAYLIDEVRPVSDDTLLAIRTLLDKRGGAMSFAALNHAAYEDDTPWNENIELETPRGRFRIDDVWKAIADQQVFVDLEYNDLSEPYTTVICSTSEQLELVKWRRPPPHAVSTHFLLTVDIGTEFMFRGRSEVYTVTALPEGKVLYRDSAANVFEVLSEKQFQSLMFSDDVQLLSPQKNIDELLAENPPISDERINKANRRFELLKRLEEVEVPYTCCKRTIQRWQKKKREAGDSLPLQKLNLIPGRPGGRGPQISQSVIDLIKETVTGGNNPTNPSVRKSFQEFTALCKERGLRPCSRNTFYQRSSQFRNDRAREGARRAYNMEPAVWYLHRLDKIHGGRPFHRVHIDHTKVDVVVKTQGKGGRIYKLRAWLSLVMDAESRAVLSFYLAAHQPSAVSCMMALRAMVARHKRVPDFIVCDNGPEFHSKAFDRFCDLNDITVDYRPAHQSRFGNVLERLFGITNTRFIHDLIGNTKATAHVRTMTRSVDPMNADHLSFVEFHGLLDYFFFVEYNRETCHPAHDHTPEQYMHKRFMETGRRLTRLRPYDTQFILQTLIPSTRGTHKINPTSGVLLWRIWYWADEFAAARYKKMKVEVYIDMWDVSVVYAIVNKKWVRCVSSLLLRYRSMTSIELRYALYEVRLRLKASPNENFESVLDDVFADHVLPPAAEATAATRMLYGRAGLTAVLPPEQGTTGSRRDRYDGFDETKNNIIESHSQDIDSNIYQSPKEFKLDYATLPVRKPT
ncbi:DDE-type integrase/transposase/recombinase [Paraburkholderia sp. BL10I2N1]|uniref:DDE-type integrase/transposase/recombinase n=1 Tax=Paraburkholderia sp. BL10I2N1 TaxID=1938796 RepID=UPI001060E610|nr:DDE-type integrase/transposase/recombinase [Paraburkholderia sp. BL10I2N1]TDN62437.1 TnsA endonuclease-like protein [Paraburkholderia sp. BL10I2N1]